MSRHALSRLCLVTLIGVSVLTVRVTGVHTHLCLDGQERPSAVHLADAGAHDEHSLADEVHQDVDVPPADGMAKGAKAGFDTPFIFAHADRLSSLAPSASSLAVRPVAAVFKQAARLLRPPLRGPPL